jgi:Helix-turn-helix domain
MSQETFRVRQKELQRVAVIASCVKGDLACARAAELLDLTPRQIKRLKTRYRQGSAAAGTRQPRPTQPSSPGMPRLQTVRVIDDPGITC